MSPARDTSATYIAWGHSTIINPWGEVVATTEHEDTIIYADLGKSILRTLSFRILLLFFYKIIIRKILFCNFCLHILVRIYIDIEANRSR